MCAAGIPAGRSVDSPVMHADLTPTMLELAGVPIPAGLRGPFVATASLREAEDGDEHVVGAIAFGDNRLVLDAIPYWERRKEREEQT